jgi:hypothetical protein
MLYWLVIGLLEALGLGLLWRGSTAGDEVLAALGTLFLVCLNSLLVMWWIARLARKRGGYPRKNLKRHPPNGELELSPRNLRHHVMKFIGGF